MPNMRTGNQAPTPGADALASIRARQDALAALIEKQPRSEAKPKELPTGVEHGTLNGYNNYRCRCWDCKTAAQEYQAKSRRAKGIPRLRTSQKHGTLSSYTHGCRCVECKKASKAYRNKQQPNEDHGTPSNYNKGCRCELCTKATSEYRKAWRERRLHEEKHGTKYTYEKFGCRCEACTVAAGKQYKRTPAEKNSGYVPEHMHGTHSGYKEYGCRCEACTAARAAAMREYRAKKAAGPTPAGVHGTLNGYKTYGCRCDDCRRANASYRAELKARHRLAAIDTSAQPEEN